jgi:disulfide bond formation protein DsbB
MTLLVDSVTKILSILTIVVQIAIILFLIYLIFVKSLFKKKINLGEKIISFFKKNSNLFLFIFSLTATLGSLFFSTIAKYIPCELCWFSRIFMYPIAIITLAALLKKDKRVYIYTIPLSIIGFFISCYHYYISTFNTQIITTCSATGPSCLINYFKEFSYITFPMMAATAFVAIFILSIFMYLNQKNKE